MKKQDYFKGLVLPLVIVGLWYGASSLGVLNKQLMPDIHSVWNAFVKFMSDGSLYHHTFISLQRVLLGFGLAAILAVPTGIILGWFPKLQPWINPMLDFLRQIPPVAWVPLLIMWFGIGEGSKLAVIFYAAYFPIMLNTQLGVSQISRMYWEVASLYKFSLFKTLIKLVIPGSISPVLTGLRLGLGMSWRSLVAAEMIAASSGLGYFINTARSLVRLDQMVVGIIVIGVFGLLIDRLFVLIERSLPWNEVKLDKREVSNNGYVGNSTSK